MWHSHRTTCSNTPLSQLTWMHLVHWTDHSGRLVYPEPSSLLQNKEEERQFPGIYRKWQQKQAQCGKRGGIIYLGGKVKQKFRPKCESGHSCMKRPEIPTNASMEFGGGALKKEIWAKKKFRRNNLWSAQKSCQGGRPWTDNQTDEHHRVMP